MSDSSQSGGKGEAKRRNRAFGCVIAGGILFITVIAVYAFGAVIYSNRTEKRIAELEQRIRDKGQPVTLEELEATYSEIPNEANAALVYHEAFASIEEVDPNFERCVDLVGRAGEVQREERLPQDLRREIGQLIAELEPVFSLFNAAIDMPNSRFEIHFSRAIEESPAHLEPLRNCAQLESLRAKFALEGGDPEHALQCQRSMLRMAESLRWEPLLMPQLVRTLIYNIAVESLAYHFGQASLPDSAMQELGALYEHAEDPDAMIRAFVGERCVSANYIEALFTGKVEMETWSQKIGEHILPQNRWFRNRVYSATNRIGLLEGFAPLVDLAGASWPERVAYWSRYEPPETGVLLPTNIVVAIIPVQYDSITAFARGTGFIRMARTALAVERYRAENGRLPGNLGPLVPKYLPEIPEDPFDGQPLRYRKLNGGYRIYSIAQDLVDDGGGVKAEKDETGNWHGDLVFEVRR